MSKEEWYCVHIIVIATFRSHCHRVTGRICVRLCLPLATGLATVLAPRPISSLTGTRQVRWQLYVIAESLKNQCICIFDAVRNLTPRANWCGTEPTLGHLIQPPDRTYRAMRISYNESSLAIRYKCL